MKKIRGIKHHLLWMLAEQYWAGGLGVDTETLCVVSPAYSQRFGELRKKGIIITKSKNNQGSYTYFLKTDPEMIDWNEFKLIFAPAVPITKIGKSCVVDDKQLVIDL